MEWASGHGLLPAYHSLTTEHVPLLYDNVDDRSLSDSSAIHIGRGHSPRSVVFSETPTMVTLPPPMSKVF